MRLERARMVDRADDARPYHWHTESARWDDLVVSEIGRGRNGRMRNSAIGVLYVLAMVAVVVGVDLLFFRDRTWFWERLASNVGIVLLFVAFYFRFSR